MTFSIAGYCQRTGMVGVAISSSSICVGARCPWVRAGTGAVATQNVTLPSIGPMVLDAIAGGLDAQSALDKIMRQQKDRAYRQVLVVDGKGNTAHFSGEKALGLNAVSSGASSVAGGNLLKSADIPKGMVSAFESGADRHLAVRLLAALSAGLKDGGEMGPVHSAALLIAHEHPWPLVDLRVDWADEDPIGQLGRLWQDYEPQMVDYVTRAIDPSTAPAYGVAGET